MFLKKNSHWHPAANHGILYGIIGKEAEAAMRQLHTHRLPALFLGFFLLPFLVVPTGAVRAGTPLIPNMSVVYGIVAALALLLFIGYCALIRQKNLWMLLVFLSVFVVNLGYFSLSISQTLSEALLANRLAYLGSEDQEVTI